MEIKMWLEASVVMSIKNRVVGGVPVDPKLIEGWIGANMPDVEKAKQAELAAATAAQLPALTEERAGGMWTTFKRNQIGIYVEGRQVKAMFKESANILREMLIKADNKGKGDKAGKSRFTNLKSKTAERLFVDDERIYFERDGQLLKEVDGNEERPIHVLTPMGPKSALKRYDFVNGPAQLKFKVRFLNDGIIDLELIETLLQHSSVNGFGADRSQGNGLFSAEIKAA